jgi:hypothetical protein
LDFWILNYRRTKYISLLTFILFAAGVMSGYSQSKLVFTGTYKGYFHPSDSFIIQYINTGSKIVKYYLDTLLKLLITGTDELSGKAECSLSQNFPNPFKVHFTQTITPSEK